ncbi:MAG TPA: hypothetical protein VGI39_39710 [Polyangiaceae bacterium]|jgi:hypothetical protein
MFKLGRLAALGVTAMALVGASAAPEPPRDDPPRDPDALRPAELHGSEVAPRAKWSCGACRKRNDTRLRVPLADVEPVVCKFCHRTSKLSFQRSAA